MLSWPEILRQFVPHYCVYIVSIMRPATSNTSTFGSKLGRISTKTPNSAEHIPAFLPTHDIFVDSRPVTAAGMAGFKGGSAIAASNNSSGQRLLRDGSYFAALLRSKREAIGSEIKRLEAEIVRFKKENAYEKDDEAKHKSVLGSVKELTGTLSDYNFTFDKYRDGANAERIEENLKALVSENRKLEEEANQMFLKKTKYERDSAKVEANISDFLKRAEEVVRREKPEKLALFHLFLTQSNILSTMIQEEKSNVNKLDKMVNLAEHSNQGRMDLRADCKFWEKRVHGLKIDKDIADDELNILKMNPTDACALQSENLKKLELRLGILDESLAQCAITNMKPDQLELNSVLPSLLHDENTPSYGEVVLFAENTDEAMVQMESEKERITTCIVDLLERTSNIIAISEQDLPTAEEYEEIKNSSKQKSIQLQTNRLTIERLQNQKSKRLQELEKAGKIEANMQEEISKLLSNIDLMTERITSFGDLKGIHESYEKEKDRLPKLLAQYKDARTRKEEDVRIISSHLESVRSELERNPTWIDLQSLEKKIREQGQNVFCLKDSVSSMALQMDYSTVKLKCAQIVDQLNVMNVDFENASY